MRKRRLDTKTRIAKEVHHTVVSDTGWEDAPTSVHIRGLHDFQRYIEFKKPLTNEELEHLINFLKDNDCPGWTGVRGYLVKDSTYKYKFTTTYDSSD